MNRKTLTYSTIRFVPDLRREEFVNIGVAVVSDDDHEGAVRFLPERRLGARLRRMDSKASARVVTRAVEELRRRARASYGARFDQMDEAALNSSGRLEDLRHAMPNQIQLSELKAYRAANVQAAADELFDRLVLPPPTERPAPAAHMTLRELRDRIEDVVARWQGNGVTVDDGSLRATDEGGHYADVWVEADSALREGRQVLAAFFAFPEDPGNRSDVFLRRDAVPTLTDAFRKQNPQFKTVAVFPPNGHEPSAFTRETKAMLLNVEGVIVTQLDHLEEVKPDVLPYRGCALIGTP